MLVVDPAAKGRGCGTEFVNFYEEMGKATARPFLRMDTNEKNRAARALYHKLGYREAGIVPCEFNGICGVGLVCLEKNEQLITRETREIFRKQKRSRGRKSFRGFRVSQNENNRTALGEAAQSCKWG